MKNSMSQQHEYLDVVKLLVNNYREDKPLLDGAVLFRGSKFGDNLPGQESPDQLHAHLLPQVAASYTHNWGTNEAFIDTYPINRESTRFFASQSLDEHLKGNPVTSYSVQDAERAIRPLVENIAYLPPGPGRDRNIQDLERFIKSSFYEAGVQVYKPGGEYTQPLEKFYYSGGPKVETAKDVFDKMERLTPMNETRAKNAYAMARASTVAKAIDKIEAFHPEASRAFQVLRSAVQRDQATNVIAKHGDKPLADFITATRAEPASDAQSRILRLAQGLAASLDSPDSSVKSRAMAVTKQIGTLDPGTATMKDVAQEITKVNQSSRTAETPNLNAKPPPGVLGNTKSPASAERSLGR